MDLDNQAKQRLLQQAEYFLDQGQKMLQQPSQTKSGSIDRGLEWFEQALKHQRLVLGEYHEDVGMTHYWMGRSLYKQSKFLEASIEYGKSLSIFESNYGRYHDITWKRYLECGKAYYSNGSTRNAFTAFIRAKRINQYMYGTFHLTLCHCKQYKAVMANVPYDQVCQSISESIALEQAGDAYRKLGDWRQAIEQYKAAAQVELSVFGMKNSSLAYLWRKIACLVGLTATAPAGMSNIDFGMLDLIAFGGIHQDFKSLMHPGVVHTIQRGDMLFHQSKYMESVAEYRLAAEFRIRRRITMESSTIRVETVDNGMARISVHEHPCMEEKKFDGIDHESDDVTIADVVHTISCCSDDTWERM